MKKGKFGIVFVTLLTLLGLLLPAHALAAPVAPSGASATILSATQVMVAWTDNSTDETGFRVERAVGAGAFGVLGTVAANVTSLYDSTVTAGNNYSYRVVATNATGDSVASNTATANVTATTQVGGIETRSVWPAAPVGVATGFPAYYQDVTGTRVSLIPITGNGLSAPTEIFDDPVAANPYSAFLGFGSEAFYWNANNIFGPANRSVVSIFAIEAAFASASGQAEAGQEVVFERTLIKAKLPLGGEGSYTIQEPYGTHVVTVTAADIGAGTGTVVLYKSDVGVSARDFVTATTGPFNTLLRQATPPPPAGWIGDGVSVGTVSGSPTAFNSVRITAPVGVNLDGAGSNILQSSNTWSVSGRLFQPIAPTGLTATAISPSQVNLAWTDNAANETGYRVERATDSTFTTGLVQTNLAVNVKSFSDTTVAAGTTYVYRVFAASGAGSSAASNVSQVSVPAVASPPNGPTGLTATAASATQVNLTWTDNSTTETGFRVERASDAAFTLNVTPTPLAVNASAFNDTTVIASTTYFYRIFAVNSAGDSLSSNVVQVSVPAGSVPPAAPSGLSALIFSPTQINLTWTDNATTETGYRVQRATDAAFTANVVSTPLPINSVSFNDTAVTAGNTYYYRVFAFNLTGDSLSSATVPITVVAPMAPGDLATTLMSATRADLLWTDNSANESTFRIERSLDNFTTAPTATFTAGVNQRVFSDNTVTSPNTYYYRVSAVNGVGTSTLSNTASVTVTGSFQVGPLDPQFVFLGNPNTGYPGYYQDDQGTRLALLPITGDGLTAPTEIFDDVDPANPYSVFLGFGTEAFYYLATSDFTTNPGNAGKIVLGVEAAFTGGTAEPGQEMVFARTRIRFVAPAAGTYTVQYPYGTKIFEVTAADIAGPKAGLIFFTDDVGLAARDFAAATTGPINRFLHQAVPPPPAGWIGDGAAIGTVTGSPTGFNALRITGPVGVDLDGAGNNFIFTDQFSVSGHLQTAVSAIPGFTKTLTPATGIAPVTVAFTDTSTGTPTAWLWNFGDGTTSALRNPTHVYNTAGNYTVKLTVTNAAGRTATTQTVSVYSTPGASFTKSAPNGLPPVTINFTDTSTGNPATWLWNFGDGTPTSTLKNPNHVYAAAGSYTISLAVTNPAGTNSTSQVLNISGNLTAAFTKSAANGVAPLTVNFTDTSAGVITGRVWNFGDGTPTSTLTNPSHIYNAAGNFTVTLTVTDAAGSAATSQTVSVFSTPVASFTKTPAFGPPPLAVNFTDTSAGNPTSWLWTFGDGTTSTLQNPGKTYTLFGTYTVTLTATNAAGTASTSQTVMVTSIDPANLKLQVGPITPISIFQGNPNTGFPSYYQDDQNTRLALLPITGNGVATPTQVFDAVDPANPYSVQLGFGTEAFYYVATAGFDTKTAAGPLGASKVVLAVEAAFGTGDAVPQEEMVFTRTRFVIKVPVPGSYTIQYPYGTQVFDVTAGDIASRGGIFFTDDVGVTPRDFLTAGTGPIGRFLHQTAPVPPAGWIGDGGSVGPVTGSPLAVPFNKVRVTGPIGVDLDGAGNNFVETNQFTVSGRIAPAVGTLVASFTKVLNPANGLAPCLVTFADTSTGTPTSWLWNFGDGTPTSTAQNPSHTYNTAGTYTVTLTVTNATGTAIASQVVVILSLPAAPINLHATIAGPAQVDLDWSDLSNNEDSFRIERATDANFTVGLVTNTTLANVITFSDTAVTPGGTYFYRVFAVNVVGSSPPSNVAQVVLAAPDAPDLTNAEPAADGKVFLIWVDKSVSENNFRIDRATNQDFTAGLAQITVPANTTTYTDAPAVTGITYFYRVAAVNGISIGLSNQRNVTPKVAVVGGGGIGGGGGGVAAPSQPVTLTGLTSAAPPSINGSGVATNNGSVTTSSGDVTLTVPAGTRLQSAAGTPVTTLTAAPLIAPPAPPPVGSIVVAYSFGPSGTQFNPPISLAMTFTTAQVPAGTPLNRLVVAYWDGKAWIKLPSVIDLATNTVTAQVSHFTDFAVIRDPDDVPAVSPTPTPKPIVTEPPREVKPTPSTVVTAPPPDLKPTPSTILTEPVRDVPPASPAAAPANESVGQSVPWLMIGIAVAAAMAGLLTMLAVRRRVRK